MSGLEMKNRQIFKIDWSYKNESVSLSHIPAIQSDKDLKFKGLKIITPKKLLTRLQIFLTQMKAGNISYKLKGKVKQTLYLLIQHNKIPRKVSNNLIKSLQWCKRIWLW